MLILLVLILFLSLGAFALHFSAWDLKMVTNHVSGTQALYTAESGLVHALSTMNRIGVTDFNHDIVQRWNALFNPNPNIMPGAPLLAYQVQVDAGPDPLNTGIITVTASGPANARRIIVANVIRAVGADGRGALYLASNSVDPTFNGSAFEIDGNDHDLSGRLVSGGVVRPGIATRNDTVTSEVKSTLANNQVSSVRGLGYTTNPPNPSVLTTGGPGVADLNQIISDILSRPGVQTSSASNVAGGSVLGAVDYPQITHLTANSVTLNGNVSGAGILIADGSVQINGNFDFIGWILVRGETTINAQSTDDTTVLGNATILGSLWTGDLNVRVGGSAIIDYSAAALTLADQLAGAGTPVPKPMLLTSWREVY